VSELSGVRSFKKFWAYIFLIIIGCLFPVLLIHDLFFAEFASFENVMAVSFVVNIVAITVLAALRIIKIE